MTTRMDEYRAGLTIHGLGWFFTGNLLEQVAWALAMLSVTMFALYMVWGYVGRYLQFEMRTEIRYLENSSIALPTLVFCLTSTMRSTLFCYKNAPYIGDSECNSSIVQNTTLKWFDYHPAIWKPATYIGNSCHSFNEDGSFYVQADRYLKMEFAVSASAKDKVLTVLPFSYDEFQARSQTYLPYDLWSRISPGFHQLYIAQTHVFRLPHPYVPNCTKLQFSPNPFSKLYSQSTCQMSCLMSRWVNHCGDVPSAKIQLSEEMLFSYELYTC